MLNQNSYLSDSSYFSSFIYLPLFICINYLAVYNYAAVLGCIHEGIIFCTILIIKHYTYPNHHEVFYWVFLIWIWIPPLHNSLNSFWFSQFCITSLNTFALWSFLEDDPLAYDDRDLSLDSWAPHKSKAIHKSGTIFSKVPCNDLKCLAQCICHSLIAF